MGKKITHYYFLLIVSLFISNLSFSAGTITANVGGGNWNAAGTWNLGRLPGCGDVIVVPVGISVHIPSNVNLNAAGCDPVTLQIDGQLTFANGKKIRLVDGGCVQISVTGLIQPSGVGGGSSELIEIGGVDWWQASDGTLLGSSSPTGVQLGCGLVLPVELVSFDIEYINDEGVISFSTASERELSLFIIEVSRDGSFWQKLGEIQAFGNSTTVQKYSIKDYSPFIGVSYYRLTSINKDGTQEQIGLISGDYSTAKYVLYPVPVNKKMFLEGSKLESMQIKVVNSLGELMQVESTFEGDKLSFNFAEVKSGVYFLIIEGDHVKKTERIVVVHK